MSEIFTLSEKINCDDTIPKEDVREFIREIKGVLAGYGMWGILKIVDDLAGDELR